MEEKEKIECAKDCRDITHEKILFAERRSSELADEFTKLEVQIATILFAFMGLFLDSFVKGLTGYSSLGVTMMKITFSFIFFFLIMSLAFGLIHIKRKEKFWDGFIIQRVSRFLKWEEAVKKEITFEQAEAFHKGTAQGNLGAISYSPIWTWLIQTICLGISISLLFVLFLVFIFH